jgi:CarboxypepD_reg-like domain
MTRFGVALALSVALHVPVLAQPTGRIEGRVYDAATGEGLVGGQVRIVETALGNVTRGDGSFFIDAVPVGVQNIQTEYLGYGEESRQATILPGRTTRLEFALGGAAIETAAIVATIAYEPWIPSVALPARAIVVSLPDKLPDATPVKRCEVRGALHGAYILDGKWQLHTSVGGLRCWSEGDDAGIAPCDQRSPTQHAAASGRGPELTRSTAPDTFHHAPGAQGADLPTPSGPEGSSGT